MIAILSASQSTEMRASTEDLTKTLARIERQYNAIVENSDKKETLRRIREFEEVKAGGSVGLYMILLLVLAIAVLVIMIFFQRTNAASAPATTRPANMANFA